MLIVVMVVVEEWLILAVCDSAVVAFAASAVGVVGALVLLSLMQRAAHLERWKQKKGALTEA